MGYEVFISHSSLDRKVAGMICAHLESCGVRCWIAPRDIMPGLSWPKSIIEALRDCKVLVLVFSKQANASPQVAREVERAFSKGLVVVPFRIENIQPSDSLEFFLSGQHWLDALTPPMKAHLDQLADTVRRLLPESAPVVADIDQDRVDDERFEREFVEVALDDWSRRPRSGFRAFLSTLLDDR